jgi:TolB-like protein
MPRRLCAAVLLAALPALAQTAPKDQKPRIFVSDITAHDVTPAQASGFTDAVVASLTNRGLFDVVSARDVQSLLGVERQRQLMGTCAAGEGQCAKDVSELLNARFVLSGQLSRLGSAYQLTLQVVDTATTRPVGRSTRLSGTFEELRSLVPYAAAEATGMPLPPPPSRVLPVTLTAVGGATAFAGLFVGLLAFSRQQVLNDELCPGGVPADGRCTGVNLRDRSYYVAQDGALVGQKGLAIGLLAGGAVLLGFGLWLFPPSDTQARLALVPTGNGFAFTGGF